MSATEDEGPTSWQQWRGLILGCAFMGLYLWLKYKSSLWQNRWVGLFVGVCFAWAILIPGGQRTDAFSKRVHLVSGIAVLACSVLFLTSFFLGGNSNTGFFGCVLLTAAIDRLRMYRWAQNEPRAQLTAKG